MEEFPRNSRKPPVTPEKGTDKQEKKVERVTTGDVVRRKPSLGRRFVQTFLKGDAKRAWGFVVGDVLVPAAKDMITDAVSQGFERMIYGESTPRGRRSSYRPGGSSSSYINYNRFSQGSSPRRDVPDDRRPISRQARASHNFDEIILTTRAEAEEVLDRLFDLVSRYESATVADLYELVGITGEYTDERWGWTDIRGTDVVRVRDGYLLNVPKPEPLSER